MKSLEFSIEQKNLRDAALVTALDLSSEKGESILTTVEILRPGLRLTRRKGSIICRAVRPVVQARQPLRMTAALASGFPHRKLDQIGRGPTGDLKCTLSHCAKALARIRWGNANLGFTPQPSAIRPPLKIGNCKAQLPAAESILMP